MKKFAVIALILVSITQQAGAAEPAGGEPVIAATKKYYLGARIGAIKNSAGSMKENSSAVGVVGGYLMGPDFALELGYTNLGSMADGILKLSALEFSAIANFPIDHQFSLFGKLGMAKSTETAGDFKITRLAATYGLGGVLDLNSAIDLRFGWDHYSFGGDVIFGPMGAIFFFPGKSEVYSATAIFKF